MEQYEKKLNNIINSSSLEREEKIEKMIKYFKSLKFSDMMIVFKALEEVSKEAL